MSYSLGAAVINSTLISLDSNPTWKNGSHQIGSIHLMGPAINRESVSRDTPFGIALGDTVSKFHNLYQSRG